MPTGRAGTPSTPRRIGYCHSSTSRVPRDAAEVCDIMCLSVDDTGFRKTPQYLPRESQKMVAWHGRPLLNPPTFVRASLRRTAFEVERFGCEGPSTVPTMLLRIRHSDRTRPQGYARIGGQYAKCYGVRSTTTAVVCAAARRFVRVNDITIT